MASQPTTCSISGLIGVEVKVLSQVGIFHSKRGRGELGELWKEKVGGREGVEERMLQTGIIRFINTGTLLRFQFEKFEL